MLTTRLCHNVRAGNTSSLSLKYPGHQLVIPIYANIYIGGTAYLSGTSGLGSKQTRCLKE